MTRAGSGTGQGAGSGTGQGAGRRSGRRTGDSGTREAILAASRQRFAELGYAGATIRGIAADAGVDPALVHHFFGTKERLFAAAMRLPVVPGELIAGVLAAGVPAAGTAGQAGQAAPAGPGRQLAGAVLDAWEAGEIRDTFLGLLRSSATSDQALIMLREFVTEAIVERLATAARGADPAEARYRAALVASQVVGLAVSRYVVGLEPLTAASRDQLAAAIGPTLDRYLTGELG